MYNDFDWKCTHCDKGFSMIGSLDFFKLTGFHVEPNKNCIIWQLWEKKKKGFDIDSFIYYVEYLIKVSFTNGPARLVLTIEFVD